jgi:hypothetical protein
MEGNMSDKCEICGRPNAGIWDDGKSTQCSAHLGDDCETCWRIGYEREKERAEKAEAREARLAAANKALANGVTRCAGIDSDLAAARRECELWKQIAGDLYAPLEERDMHMCSASEPGDVHANVCGTFGPLNCPLCMTAALAAPAAGEEGKR